MYIHVSISMLLLGPPEQHLQRRAGGYARGATVTITIITIITIIIIIITIADYY